MSTNQQIKNLLETMREYDTSTVQNAILRWVKEKRLPENYVADADGVCPWQLQSELDLCDEIIAACQQPQD